MIRSKTTEAQYQRIINYVATAVEAAQQLYKVLGPTFDRKQYVVDWLKAQKFNITEAQLDALIESAVFELNRVMEEAKSGT